ncbi:MAG: indole-3-glycerol phosphate synthase TrpC [Actinomycetaceae bacterium]|nr:indole-3-glycerol phosphate synthase TrpC [Actinomycetaceae bacterium]
MSVLEAIVKDVQADLKIREQQTSLKEIKERARRAPAPRNAIDALRGPGAVTVMAEIKRRSPDSGLLAEIPDPVGLALEFQEGGAAMISYPTERRHFAGSFAELEAVRRAVDVPVLCKDMIISPYQIHEARAHGADMVLLFAAVLSPEQLHNFIERIESLGMTALVEVQSRLEVVCALEAGARAIGVNARNLHTLEIDRSNFEQVVDLIPADVVAVAESGVRNPHDVFKYAQAGADSVLVGQSLSTVEDPRRRVADMVSAAQHPALLADRKQRIKRGVTNRQYELYYQD